MQPQANQEYDEDFGCARRTPVSEQTHLLYRATANKRESVQLLDAVMRFTTSTNRQGNDTSQFFARIQKLSGAGADPNVTDFWGRTCLHWLTTHWTDDIGPIVDLLLSIGASPNISDDDGCTPLLYAARCPNEKRQLIEKLISAGVDVNKWDPRGISSLHHVVSNGTADIVRILLSNGASPITAVDRSGNTPLMMIMQNPNDEERLEIARELIAAGADVNKANSEGKTSLHFACQYGNEEMVKLLLDCGASLTATDKNGFNALLWATMSKNVELVRQLIEAGCNVNFVNKIGAVRDLARPKTALHMAILNCDHQMVKCLLECGANPNLIRKRGPSILLLALENSGFPTLELLLSHGADMYDGGSSRPPFEYLVGYYKNSKTRVCKTRFLLEHGLDLGRYNPQDALDFSPLHRAIERCKDTGYHDRLLSLILVYDTKRALNLEHWNQNGYTPLCTAVLKKSPICVKLLLRYGAKVDQVSSCGRTPLGIGVRNKWVFEPECVRLLVEAGAVFRKVLGIFEQYPSDAGEVEDEEETKNRIKRAQCIVKYRLWYETQNPSVEQSITHNFSTRFVVVQSYYEACKDEINFMKEYLLHESISLHDIFIANENFHKRVRNYQVYVAFNERTVWFRFPLYAEDLCKRFRRVKIMHNIWERAVKSLSRLLALHPDAYYSIIRNILDYLHESDILAVMYSLETP